MRGGSKPKDITGNRYGRLVALCIAGADSRRRKKWLCKCDCGNESIVLSSNLVRNATKSCGCLLKEARVESNTTHGMSGTKIFALWEKMIGRCELKTNPAYKNYGGRGIYVCDRWKSFVNFYADMGDRPEGMSLDRINNDGPYAPENCRWATRLEQGRNTRKNRLIEFNGTTKCLSEWCEALGFKTATICQRLNKYGWSVEKALTTAVQLPREERAAA